MTSTPSSAAQAASQGLASHSLHFSKSASSVKYGGLMGLGSFFAKDLAKEEKSSLLRTI
jgi:hypothetical protein